MANPFYSAPKGSMGAPDFVKFMQSMKGKDPNQIISNMVNSGQISQQQLNIVQQKAKQFSGLFKGFKSVFGFCLVLTVCARREYKFILKGSIQL